MKIIKVFIPVLLLASFFLCPFLPKETLPEPTPSETSKTMPQLQESNTATTVVETSTPTIPSVLPSPTTESLIPNNLGEITIDNIQDLEVFGEIPYSQVQPDHNIFLMNLSNEGTKLVVISENWDTRKRALVVWDLITNSQMMEIIDPPYLLWWASFSPDDHQLWVLREDFIDQYNLEQGELVNTIDFPEYDRGAAAISPDGKYIVTGIYLSLIHI